MKKNNNAGFSLVEMVVSVLIASLLMLGVAAFVSTSRITYSKVTTEAKLQEESNAATNFLNELLRESKKCGISGEITDAGTHKKFKYIWIKALENDPGNPATNPTPSPLPSIRDESYYFIIFEMPGTGEQTGVLRYKKVPATDSNINIADDGTLTVASPTTYFSDVIGNNHKYICGCVTSMTLQKESSINGSLYKVQLEFLYNGQTFSATVNNMSRNLAVTPSPVPSATPIPTP